MSQSHIGQVAVKKPGLLLALAQSSGGGTPAFDESYQAILDYAALQGFVAPSAQVQRVQNALVSELKSAGIWDMLDLLYNFFSDGDADFAKINWIAPGTFQAAAIAPLTFLPINGFQNTSTGYINTTWNPSLNAVKYKLGTATVFWEIMKTTAESLPEFGCEGGVNLEGSSFRAASPLTSIAINGRAITSLVSSQSKLVNTNLFNTTMTLFSEGVSLAQITVAPPTALPAGFTLNLFRLNRGTPTVPSVGIYRVFGIGASIIGQEANLHTIWSTYEAVTVAVTAYQAIIDYATLNGYALPSPPQRIDQIALIAKLYSTGVWTSLDVFYNFLGTGDHNFAKINWKAPGSFQAVGTGHEPTYTVNRGFDFNGTTQYLDTTWNPAVNGVNYKLDDASMGVHHYENVAEDRTSAGAVQGANLLSINARATTNSFSAAINDTSPILNALQTSLGFSFVKRFGTVGNRRSIFKDGIFVKSDTRVSTAIPSFPVYVGAQNANGVASFFNTRGISMFCAGNALEGKEFDLFSAWNEYSDKYVDLTHPYDDILAAAAQLGYAVPSAGQQLDHRALIDKLLVTETWGLLDFFYVFYNDAADSNFSRINWIDPSMSLATNIGAPVWAPNSGFTFPTPADQLNLNFTPSTQSFNYTLDAGSFGGYFDSSPTPKTTNQFLISNTDLYIIPNYTPGNSLGSNLENGWLVANGGFDTGGMFQARRTNNGNIDLWVNGVLRSATVSTRSKTLPAVTMKVSGSGGANNFNGSAKMVFYGATLLGKETIFNDAWMDYFAVTRARAAYKVITDFATLNGYTLPTALIQTQQELFLSNLIRYNIWDRLDILYVMTAGSREFASLNWKNPAVFQMADIVAPPPWQEGIGVTGVNVTGARWSTTWRPLTNGVQYKQNDASMIEDIIAYGAGTFTSGIQYDTTNQVTAGGATTTLMYLNDSASLGAAKPFPGLIHKQRTAATVFRIFKNGGQLGGTGSGASAALRNDPMHVGGAFNVGACDITSRLFACGSSLVNLEALFSTSYQSYKAAIGIDFEPEYNAIINRAIFLGYAPPSAPQQALQNQMIVHMKATGIWPLLDTFYCFANDSVSRFWQLNWKDPLLFQCQSIGAITKLSNLGIKGGTSIRANSTWIPGVHGVNYTDLDCSLGVWFTTRSASAAYNAGIRDVGLNEHLVLRYNNSSLMQWGVHAAMIGYVLGTPDGSAIHIKRVGGTMSMLVNGGGLTSSAVPSVGIPMVNAVNWAGASGTEGVLGVADSTIGIGYTGASLAGKEEHMRQVMSTYMLNI